MKKTYIFGFIALSLASCQPEGGDSHSDHQAETNDTEQTAVDQPSAESSIDWTGMYTGSLPSRSCPNSKDYLEINEENTFYFLRICDNNGKKDTLSMDGHFSFDDTGDKISLDLDMGSIQFKVVENRLIQLDEKGKLPHDSASTQFTLTKAKEDLPL